MPQHTLKLKKMVQRRSLTDHGQTALILVVAVTIMLTIFGGVMVTSITNNEPVITQASIQRYAYRAMASGLNSYQNLINANPYLAACNSSTNNVGQCSGIRYQDWSEVPGTDAGNGVIPEYYKYDNPQQIIDPTTQAITYLEVQIVGAAGYPGKYVYYSTIAKFTPANGFLNAVWWSNYESSEFPNGTAANCDYFYNQGRNINGDDTVGSTPCDAVFFQSGDALYGPVYSNDSLYITGTPTFTGTVNTADPHCLFIDDGAGKDDAPACNGVDAGHYTVAGSGFGHAKEPLPTDNSKLAATAQQGGCYYEGPTTVTLSVVGGVGKMTVNSPQTTGYPSNDTMNTPTIGDPNCPTATAQGAQNLPTNGVIYVNAASCTATCNAGANPFDPNTGGISQVQSNCSNCYYGQSASPDKEGDAFVSNAAANGGLSGHLTVAASNDVIVDGPLTYTDCTSWTGTASESLCNYNNATTGTNDTLGLIANNYIEVNRPIYNNSASFALRGTPLPDCGAGQVAPPPLCDPATTTGSPTGGQGLTINATILALSQSFVVNNYDTSGNEGQLTVYGSIQQDARGPVGLVGGTGYVKYYQYDPRLTLYGPPYYLTPGTPSWALDSSAESYQGTQPSCPPVEPIPVKADGTVAHPYPTFPIAGSTAAGTAGCPGA